MATKTKVPLPRVIATLNMGSVSQQQISDENGMAYFKVLITETEYNALRDDMRLGASIGYQKAQYNSGAGEVYLPSFEVAVAEGLNFSAELTPRTGLAITISPSEITIGGDDVSEHEIQVTCLDPNADWYVSSLPWVTVRKTSSTTAAIRCTVNDTGVQRGDLITFSLPEGGDSVSLSVRQLLAGHTPRRIIFGGCVRDSNTQAGIQNASVRISRSEPSNGLSEVVARATTNSEGNFSVVWATTAAVADNAVVYIAVSRGGYSTVDIDNNTTPNRDGDAWTFEDQYMFPISVIQPLA